MRRPSCHLVGALFLVLAGAGAGGVHAAPDAARPEPANAAPRAVLGGVLAIALKPPPPGKGLPDRVPLTLRDGPRTESLEGITVWLVEPTGEVERHWTRSANPLEVRTLPAGADPRTLLEQGVARVDAAMVLVDVPMTSDAATLECNGVLIEPQWLEPGPSTSIDPERGATWRDDRPDPCSPFEWWRWTLVADESDEPAPAPPGDAASQLMARHVADLWRAGIARVSRSSRGVALTLRSWLTAVCRENADPDGIAIAGWIADAGELAALLSLLLDQSRDDETVMKAALAWTDARTPLTLWIEADAGGELLLAATNPMEREVVVRIEWAGEQAPPLATLLPPRSVERMHIARPKRPLPTGVLPMGGGAEPLILMLEAEQFRKRVSISPAAVLVRPPATSFGEFLAPFSLAEAQSGRLIPVDRRWATTASIRRRDGRWELFAECFAARELGDDSLRVRVGAREFTVRRDGSIDGEGASDLELGVRSFPDRWRARLALPSTWSPRVSDEGAIADIALRRDAGAIRATAVLPTPAQEHAKHEMPLVEVDLSAWSSDR